jgi:hypothetical protein
MEGLQKMYFYPMQSKLKQFWPSSYPLGLGLVLVLLLLRFLQLEADPSFLKVIHDIDDEGWWAAPAIQFLRHETWFLDGQSGGFLLAPLYSLLLAGWMKGLGISVASVKLFHLLFLLLTVLGIRRWMGSENKVWPWLAAIFLSNFFWFDFSRIGYPENLQFCGLIWSFVLGRQWMQSPSWLRSLGLGLLVSAILLVKLSFLGFMPAVLLGFWLVSRGQIIRWKQLGLALGIPILALLFYYFLLFLPFQESFQQQKAWMALTFQGLSDTFNYHRILFWLFHTIQVPFFQHFSNLLWVVLVLVHWKEKGFGSGLALGLLLTLVVLNLLGDGSERRLVFLFFPLLLAFSDQEAVPSKPLSIWAKLLLSVFMAGNCYFFIQEQLPDLPANSWSILSIAFSHPWRWVALSITLLGFIWTRGGWNSLKITLDGLFKLLSAAFLLAWLVSAFLGLSRQVPSFSSQFFPFLFLLVALVLTIFILFSLYSSQNLFPWLLGLCLVVNVGFQVQYHWQAQYQRKNLAEKLDRLLLTTKLAGPNLSFGLHPMGKFQPLYHSDIALGYGSIFRPELLKADFYMDVYPAFEKPYDPLFVVGEILNVGKSAEEVFRDSLYSGANRQVVVVYDLRGNARIGKTPAK